jgi:hypothetical protein
MLHVQIVGGHVQTECHPAVPQVSGVVLPVPGLLRVMVGVTGRPHHLKRCRSL